MSTYRTDTSAVEIELPESSCTSQAGFCAAEKSAVPVPEAAATAVPHPVSSAGGKSAPEVCGTAENFGFRSVSQHGVREYRPECRLIDSVKITPWHTDYSYYEQFCAQALKLKDLVADPCPELPFFSYMPQYSQMTAEQLSYYLYLRSEIREGRFPHADYTYLLLLVYETINLSAQNPLSYSLDMLSAVYVGYRREYERLGTQLSDWICDFCLANACPLPEKLRPLIPELAGNAYLKEFYIGSDSHSPGSGELLRWVSAYDYTKSRFARDGNRPLYDRHMSGVLNHILEVCPEIFSGKMLEKHTVSRDAYVGALCSPRIKKRMEISCFSFSHSHELHFLVSDILKFTENRIRASLGIKSRLSHGKLPPEIQRAAEEYFASVPGFGRRKPEEETPAYEKLYEPKNTELSFESAAAIEAASWQTTGKLVEAFAESGASGNEMTEISARKEPAAEGLQRNVPAAEDAAAEKERNIPAGNSTYAAKERNVPATADETAENGTAFWDLLDAAQKKFVLAVLHGSRPEQRTAAAEAGLTPDLMADAVNSVAQDSIEDIILEMKDGQRSVMDDYLDEIPKECRT